LLEIGVSLTEQQFGWIFYSDYKSMPFTDLCGMRIKAKVFCHGNVSSSSKFELWTWKEKEKAKI